MDSSGVIDVIYKQLVFWKDLLSRAPSYNHNHHLPCSPDNQRPPYIWRGKVISGIGTFLIFVWSQFLASAWAVANNTKQLWGEFIVGGVRVGAHVKQAIGSESDREQERERSGECEGF
jgi:hypothetical protein